MEGWKGLTHHLPLKALQFQRRLKGKGHAI
jgi:hypothetical protein